jgi:hypothetical protein
MSLKKKSSSQSPSIFLDDLYQVAYLWLNGATVTPVSCNGRVSFETQFTSDVASLMVELQRNEPVPVGDFIRACKAVRGQMLSLRGVRK